jgi:hypothetical protein
MLTPFLCSRYPMLLKVVPSLNAGVTINHRLISQVRYSRSSTPESVPCCVAVLSARGRQDSPPKLCAEHQNESYTFQALNNSVAVMLERENSYDPDFGIRAW